MTQPLDIDDPALMNNIVFADEYEQALFAKAQLGHQTLQFLRTPTGRFLHGRAKLVIQEMKDELSDINPWSFFGRRKWKRAQLKLRAAQHFLQWCSEAIEDGLQAENTLDEYSPE